MSPGHHEYSASPMASKNHDLFNTIDLNLFLSSAVRPCLLTISDKPIPAQIINMEVELPVKRVMNLPAKVVLLNDPKQKLKLTMYMPKIA
jgi:hypothetical protein